MKRLPASVRKHTSQTAWRQLHRVVWERDKRQCSRCGKPLTLRQCNLDQIDPNGVKRIQNLRCLCRACFVLRLGPQGMMRAGMIAGALADGTIPHDWRPLAWE